MKQQPLEKIISIIILATVLCNGSLWSQEGLRYLDRSLPCLERNFNLQVIMPVDSLSGEPLVSQLEINNVLEQSSSYFEPICLSFTSCSYNQINNYGFNTIENFSRVEEMGALYSFPRRITVLFVNEIDGDDCGFSYYDGFQTTDEAQIFIEISCDDGMAEQMAHHMGNLLGLLGTNAGLAEELVDGSNCAIAGDLICDTPADPYGAVRDTILNMWVEAPKSEIYEKDCEFIWETQDVNGEYFTPSVCNIMSPYPCKSYFTYDQFVRMLNNYNRSPIKQY